MKNLGLFAIALFSAALITSCQPENKKETPKPKSTTTQSDQSGTAEVDAAMQNVNDIISNGIGGGSAINQKLAAGSSYALPCGVVKIDTVDNGSGGKIYKVDYGDKTQCVQEYKYKSGIISLGLASGKRFSDVGGTYTITFTDYVAESQITNNTIKLNGTLTITNVNGGYIWQAVVNDATIVHKIAGTITVTYANGESRARTYSQKRTWDATQSQWDSISLTIAGDGANGVSETGKTYDGNYDYTTTISTDFKWENCTKSGSILGTYKLTQGKARMNVTVPAISPAYIDVEGGYNWNVLTPATTPVKAATNCEANAYQITTVIGTLVNTTSYQLY